MAAAADQAEVNTSRAHAPLDDRARAALAVGLDAVDGRTGAPLRVHGHLARPDVDLFELREEREAGDTGRRFIVSVDHVRETVVILAPGAA